MDRKEGKQKKKEWKSGKREDAEELNRTILICSRCKLQNEN